MNKKGFTLIELLLVVVIIGLMLAVIVPRAWRANIDAKYGLVRQNCSELASFGIEWAEKSILAQDEIASMATLNDYLATLANTTVGSLGSMWVADNGNNNWNNGPTQVIGTSPIVIDGRYMNGSCPAAPEDTVEDVTPPDKTIRNPFNGISVYELPNFPTNAPVTGAIACGVVVELSGGWHYYAFVFQGTDSTSITLAQTDAFHAGQHSQTLPGLRNGIFFARLRGGGAGCGGGEPLG